MTATTPPCSCLLEEGRPPRRSLGCPVHGCTCGTGRRSEPAHRGTWDGSCPTHGTEATGTTGAPSAPVIPPLDPAALAEVDHRILANEKRRWKYQGAKEQECARIFGGLHSGAGTGSPVTRYYQRLNRLIDHPEANRLEPALCARLRAQREDH